MANEGGDAGPIIWNPAGIIAKGVTEGLSGRQIIQALRDAGMGLRDAVVYRTIGEVRAAIANRETIAQINTSILPSPDQYAQWSTARNGYSTQLLIFTRDRETGLIGETVSSYTTTDPHTPDEAIAAKQADWEDLTESGSEYDDQQYLGAVVYNLFQMVAT